MLVKIVPDFQRLLRQSSKRKSPGRLWKHALYYYYLTNKYKISCPQLSNRVPAIYKCA